MRKAVKSLVILVAAALLVFITACVPAPGEIAPALVPTPESTPAPAPTPEAEPAPEADWGTIEVRATDPPPADVEHVVVELSEVEVHYVSGNATEWVTIVGAPPSFDLMEVLDGVEVVLGSANVTAGKYTQIRMEVDQVTVVTTAGDSITAEIPSGTLKIVRPFTVEPGGTTVLILDFDGEKSLILPGKDLAAAKERAIFKPVVKLLIEHEEGEGEGEGEQAQEREEEQEREGEQESDEASALEAIEEVEAELAELLAWIELGGITLPADAFDEFNALLTEAKSAFDNGIYEEAERLAESAEEILSDIAEMVEDVGEDEEIRQAIEEVEAELAEMLAQLASAGITLPADFFDGLNALLTEAKNALADVDYEEAERLVEETAQALSYIAEEISDLIEELEGEGGEGEEE